MLNATGMGQLLPGQTELTEEQYNAMAAQYYGGEQSQTATNYANPVNTLAGQSNPGGTTGGGAPFVSGGNTKNITLSDGRQLLIDMDDGHVISQYGNAEPSKYGQESALQQERFAHEDAQSAQKYQQAKELRDTDPQNDPWRSMMPRYSPPSAVQGPRGALDIMDPNTGQLINVRQPEAPPVRVVGGNLIVDPGANAAVYYNGNKGQATNVSGGPQMVYGNAQFPSAMSLGEQVAGKLQNRGAGGGSNGGAGGMGGGRAGAAGGGGSRGPGMSQFRNPSAPMVANRFADPGPGIDGGPMPRPPWESPSWQDPYDIGGPRQIDLGGYDTSEPLDPFGPDMNYDFGYNS